MLAAIKQLFRPDAAPQPGESPGHRTRLAAAALLIEVVRSDDHVSAEERGELLATLDRKFGLDRTEAAELIKLAEAQVHQATDLYQFTSQINRNFTAQQKVKLIEELWRVAYADQTLHRHEEHLIRRIADLIHVPHPAFISAKLKVQPAPAE